MAVSALVLVAACGGGDGDSEASTSDRCVAVNQVNLDAIASTLTDGEKITEGAAVKSKDYENVYMIAAKFGDQTGVWATNDDPTDATVEGVLMAGDGFAREFSNAVQGKVENGSEGMAEAKKCLG